MNGRVSYPINGAAQTEGATAGTWLGRGRRKGIQKKLPLPAGRKSLGPRGLPSERLSVPERLRAAGHA